MPKTHRIRVAIALILIVFGFCSCRNKAAGFHILTDRKELAIPAEIFDAVHPDIYITIRHVPHIDAYSIGAEKPDLVIGRHLMADEIVKLLRRTESEFPIYSGFKDNTDARNRHYFTHLSFGLPLIVGKKEVIAKLPDPVTVDPEQLRAASIPFLKLNADGRPMRLGFSPSWKKEFYTNLLLLRNPAAFKNGIMGIDRNLIDAVVAESRDWIRAASGGVSADSEFNRRYRYVADEYLILNDRILFTYMDFEQWNSLPDDIAKHLDFRYLAGPSTITITSVTSAAVPRKSRHFKLATQFIDWLMSPETQRRIMKRWNRDGIVVFGFLNGLSTLPEINETALITRFPAVEGKIPEAHYYTIPNPLPHQWLRIQESVLSPWFAAAISMENTLSLPEAYQRWELSSLVEVE